MKVDTIFGVSFAQRPGPENDHRPRSFQEHDPGEVFYIKRRKPVRKELDRLGRSSVQYPFRQMAQGEAILLPIEGLTSKQIKRMYKSAWQAADQMDVNIACRRSWEYNSQEPYLVLTVLTEYQGPINYAE